MKTSKLRVTGLCEGSPPVTVGDTSQGASNADNDSIWWRHHGSKGFMSGFLYQCVGYIFWHRGTPHNEQCIMHRWKYINYVDNQQPCMMSKTARLYKMSAFYENRKLMLNVLKCHVSV